MANLIDTQLPSITSSSFSLPHPRQCPEAFSSPSRLAAGTAFVASVLYIQFLHYKGQLDKGPCFLIKPSLSIIRVRPFFIGEPLVYSCCFWHHSRTLCKHSLRPWDCEKTPSAMQPSRHAHRSSQVTITALVFSGRDVDSEKRRALCTGSILEMEIPCNLLLTLYMRKILIAFNYGMLAIYQAL